MTKNQRSNVMLTIVISVIVSLAGIAVWLVVAAFSSPAAANQVPVPSVNARNYEIIKTSQDGTIDHYCDGMDGIWFGPDTGDFAVLANDPLCK